MEPQDATTTPPASEVRRLTGVCFDPGAVFADIANNGRWWAAWLIITILISVFMSLVISRVGYDQIIAKTMESNPRMQEMPADQKEKAVEMQRKIMPYALRLGPVLGGLVMVLVAAGALLFVFNFMFDAGLKFKQVLNLYAYSGIPPSVVSIAASILVLYLKAPDEFDIQKPLAFNVGAFLPETSAKWLQSIGASLDVFTFWQIALVAVGFSAVCGAKRMPFGRALTGVLIPWIAYVLAKTAWAAMFG
ncbi:YIP1 family protein [uncultured Paludibaculum sp.]|uniref:YIP1 family protein n=1 Tax=uncultured Paludibaculum sp. TaxID=1765020 RepID=UPI002AAA8968|nr:YIP1 family protein [uncultured Paludibaculum sp.]